MVWQDILVPLVEKLSETTWSHEDKCNLPTKESFGEQTLHEQKSLVFLISESSFLWSLRQRVWLWVTMCSGGIERLQPSRNRVPQPKDGFSDSCFFINVPYSYTVPCHFITVAKEIVLFFAKCCCFFRWTRLKQTQIFIARQTGINNLPTAISHTFSDSA